MTDPDLAALLDAATPRPWEVSKVQGQDELRDEWHIATGDDPAEFPGAMWIRGPKFVDCDDTGLFFTPADAALIVAAVNALPRLLEIEREARATITDCEMAPGSFDSRRWCIPHMDWSPCSMANLRNALSPQEPTP